MRLLENWTKPRDGELVSGFVVAREGDHLLCVGEDGMAVRLEPPALRRFNPTRGARTRHLLILAGLGWQLAGCAKSAPPLSPAEIAIVSAALECDRVVEREIAKVKPDECPKAQLAINTDRVCAIAFPMGIDLGCPEFRK